MLQPQDIYRVYFVDFKIGKNRSSWKQLLKNNTWKQDKAVLDEMENAKRSGEWEVINVPEMKSMENRIKNRHHKDRDLYFVHCDINYRKTIGESRLFFLMTGTCRCQ